MIPRAFVVMPFGIKDVLLPVTVSGLPSSARERKINFDLLYTMLLCPALKKAGCEPFRADAETSAGDIRTDMFFELVTADIVLTDISLWNPNVFYELGIRHGVMPSGTIIVHGDWLRLPFNIAPDRAFKYQGALFLSDLAQDEAWMRTVEQEVDHLAKILRQVIESDQRTVASPLYKELPGLKAVDWVNITTAKAKYFNNLIDDWRERVRTAMRNGYPGDILTLAQDAPTRYFWQKIQLSAVKSLIQMYRFRLAEKLLQPVVRETSMLDAECQMGIIFTRTNRHTQAEALMQRLTAEHPGDPEVHGILGRVYKDVWRSRWISLPDLPARQEKARESAECAAVSLRSYHDAFLNHLDSYYNGINAITLHKLLTHLGGMAQAAADEAISYIDNLIIVTQLAATATRTRHLNQLDSGSLEEAIWATATLGELELLLGREEGAIRFYLQAMHSPEITYFQLKSMHEQLETLVQLDYCASSAGKIMRLLESNFSRFPNPNRPQFGKVVVCSGHMIDAPNRPEPRFPPKKENAVRDKLAQVLDRLAVGSGDLAISGGARGGDIIFAELCQARGAAVRMLIPLPEAEFLNTSVRLPGSNWVARYYALKRDTEHCEFWLQDEHIGLPSDRDQVFSRNNRWIINTAQVESGDHPMYAILVWNELPAGDGPGGTSHFADEFNQRGGEVTIINPIIL